ncbi:hypothetical protein [Roseovarius ramblicola]|uniref:SURF1-like protein n=1 Tax=Roseovarius ramblicola TaxID=2022336 RepID=A0ABV5I1Y9_9RHOB
MAMPFPDIAPPRADRRAARARRARLWAWPVRLALLACLGVAIWQEPRLSPSLHARMQATVAHAQAMLERTAGAGRRLAWAGRISPYKGAGVSGWIVEVLSP